jgi:hypothetical protein
LALFKAKRYASFHQLRGLIARIRTQFYPSLILRRYMNNNENGLRNFLTLSYDELEQLNLEAKEQRKNRVAPDKIREQRLKYFTDEK